MKQAATALLLSSFASLVFAGTEVSHRRYRDETARVEYSWIENCTSKQLTVTAAVTKMKDDGVTVDAGPIVSVYYATYTFCDPNNTEQTFWFGSTNNASVRIDSNLSSARVIAPSLTLQGFAMAGSVRADLGSKSVAADIVWSSDDRLDKYAGTIVTKYPGYHEVNHLTGFYRLATARGTVSDGASEWFPAVPESNSVQLYRLNRGESILIKD